MTASSDHPELERDMLSRELETVTAERDEARLIVRHLVSVMNLDRAYLAEDAQQAWRLAKYRAEEWPK